MNQPLKRTGAALLILVILQLACEATPSLWGTPYTPTPDLTTVPPTLDPVQPPLATDFPALPLTPALTPTAITSFVTPTPAGPVLPGPTAGPTYEITPYLYDAQSGDTLEGVAKRFNVAPSEIRSGTGEPVAAKGLIDPNTVLVIPSRISQAMTPNIRLIPDVELIYSKTAADFGAGAVRDYVLAQNGYLASFREYLGSTGWTWGYESIYRLAIENSINPRLLLALLEYESRWVRGQPVDALHASYPMGYEDFRYKGMFTQMVWAVNQLSIGYYGWRLGTITELNFIDGTRLRLDPRLNAGTVALQYLFSKLHSQSQWSQIIDQTSGFPALYSEMFGDPWARAARVGDIFPAKIPNVDLVLPFDSNVEWSYTGGPHGAWEHDGALAAIDFAPATDHGGCAVTDTWVTAAAQGNVVRSDRGVVDIDLDDDGFEETGWNLLYLHIATKDRIPLKKFVYPGDRIGHASCEGGVATGTHVHFARKFNGEWVAADGPLPMILDGWQVVAGAKPYEGMLVKGSKTIVADPVGQAWSVIFRESNVVPTPVGP